MMIYKKDVYKSDDYHVIKNNYGRDVYFLAQFIKGDRIRVVCDDMDFAAFCLDNQGEQFNKSFGKKLKDIYLKHTNEKFGKMIKNKVSHGGGVFTDNMVYSERTEESVGLEMFVHVFYLLMGYGYINDELNMSKKISIPDAILRMKKGKEDMVKSCLVADIDIINGNSKWINGTYRTGSLNRKLFNKDVYSFLKRNYICYLTTINSKEKKIDY